MLSIVLQAAIPSSNESLNVLSLIMSSDPLVQFTLAVLIFFSIFSWTIILFKIFQIRNAKKSMGNFLVSFDASHKLEDLLTRKNSGEDSPTYEIFLAGIRDILSARQSKAKDPGYQIKVDLGLIRKRIQQSSDNETSKLESYTPFLATTASACPFIGLFGTVWGILTAFWVLKGQGSSSIQVVGPYIAEALIATAVGLAAAIPAVMAYNYFVTKIRGLARDYDDFSLDLLRRIEHEYF